MTSLTDTLADWRARQGRKLIRFGAVSAFNVVFGQLVLYFAQVLLQMEPVIANITSVAVGTIPAYILSRYWVWNKRGKNHWMREVLPFWILAFIGFALSTAAVWFVDARWDPSPIVVNLTSLGAFGVVWLAKFFVLDRYLFRADPAEGP